MIVLSHNSMNYSKAFINNTADNSSFSSETTSSR